MRNKDVPAIVATELPSLVELYKDLHTNPELSLHEERTAAILAKELREAGLEVTENVGGYGIVGVLKNGEGPVILVRTYLDALPVKEQTRLPYASTKTVKDDLGRDVPVLLDRARRAVRGATRARSRVALRQPLRGRGPDEA